MFSINMKVAKLGAFEIELKGQEDNGTYGKHLGGFCSCLTRGISAFAEIQHKMCTVGCNASICFPYDRVLLAVCARRPLALGSVHSHQLHQSPHVRDTSDALQLAVAPRDVSRWIL